MAFIQPTRVFLLSCLHATPLARDLASSALKLHSTAQLHSGVSRNLHTSGEIKLPGSVLASKLRYRYSLTYPASLGSPDHPFPLVTRLHLHPLLAQPNHGSLPTCQPPPSSSQMQQPPSPHRSSQQPQTTISAAWAAASQ